MLYIGMGMVNAGHAIPKLRLRLPPSPKLSTSSHVMRYKHLSQSPAVPIRRIDKLIGLYIVGDTHVLDVPDQLAILIAYSQIRPVSSIDRLQARLTTYCLSRLAWSKSPYQDSSVLSWGTYWPMSHPQKKKKKRLFRLMGMCVWRSSQPRRIIRGPRCPDYPPGCPNPAICPNDSSLELTARTQFVRLIGIYAARASS